MSRLITFLTLLLAAVMPTLAQEIVSGTILDRDGEPMPGVRVEIVGRNEFAYTDIDGAFRIEVPVKASKVRVSYPGFKPIERKIKPDMTIKIGHGWQGRDSGYRGFFDWNLGFGFGGNASIATDDDRMAVYALRPWAEFGMTTSHGYQINRNLYVGVGAGVNFMFSHAYDRGIYGDYDYNWETGDYSIKSAWHYTNNYVEFAGFQFPFFVDVRWDFGLGNRIAPFIGLKMGYQINLAVDQDYELFGSYNVLGPVTDLWVYHHNVNGFFLQPTIGLRRSIGAKRAVNLGLTMNVFALHNLTAEEWTYVPSQGDQLLRTIDMGRSTGSVLMLNIGFDF